MLRFRSGFGLGAGTPAGADVESMLFLADLGGSEKVLKSGAHETVKAPGAIDAGEDEEAPPRAEVRRNVKVLRSRWRG